MQACMRDQVESLCAAARLFGFLIPFSVIILVVDLIREAWLAIFGTRGVYIQGNVSGNISHGMLWSF